MHLSMINTVLLSFFISGRNQGVRQKDQINGVTDDSWLHNYLDKEDIFHKTDSFNRWNWTCYFNRNQDNVKRGFQLTHALVSPQKYPITLRDNWSAFLYSFPMKQPTKFSIISLLGFKGQKCHSHNIPDFLHCCNLVNYVNWPFYDKMTGTAFHKEFQLGNN